MHILKAETQCALAVKAESANRYCKREVNHCILRIALIVPTHGYHAWMHSDLSSYDILCQRVLA